MRKLLCAIFSVFSVTQAQSYQLTEDFVNGFYWQSLPVNMRVIDGDANRLALIKRLVDDAVQTWENVGIQNLWTMSAQQVASVGGNSIRWSNNFAADTGLDPNSILAVTIRWTGGPYIARSEIIINGNNVINQTESNLRTVILHELGHTLGLDHSQYSNAVMAANLILGFNSLHSDDRAGIQAVTQQTLNRQAIGYISPLAGSEETTSESPLSCGTVDLTGGGSGGPGTGLFSMVLGLMLALVATGTKLRKRG